MLGGLASNKHSSLLQAFVNYGRKKLCNIGHKMAFVQAQRHSAERAFFARLSIKDSQNKDILYQVSLSRVLGFSYCYAECLNAVCLNAECCNAEYRNAECRNA
jgi:hypothetical protein